VTCAPISDVKRGQNLEAEAEAKATRPRPGLSGRGEAETKTLRPRLRPKLLALRPLWPGGLNITGTYLLHQLVITGDLFSLNINLLRCNKLRCAADGYLH